MSSTTTVPRDASGRRLAAGELAGICGTTVSALRHYERVGVLLPERSAGNHRRYRPDAVLRLRFILVERSYGVSLDDIRLRLSRLPEGRPPTPQETDLFLREWRSVVCERIRSVSCPDGAADLR